MRAKPSRSPIPAHTEAIPGVPDDVLGVDAAAAFLKVSTSWLYNSDVPRARLGRRIVFLRSQLLAYVESRLTHRLQERAS